MQKAAPEWRFASRPALTERFLASLSGRLSLVVAPLGYGKTTLLRQWQAAATAAGRRSVFLSFEPGRGSQQGFARLLTRALPDVFGRLLTGPSDIEAGWLVDRLAPERLVLFLDDFHLADAEDERLACDLMHRAGAIHLAIAARENPKLPLAKLRLAGPVNDVGPEALRLDTVSATELFPADTDPAVIAACLACTDGWPAAMRLLQSAMPALSIDALHQVRSAAFQTSLGTYLNEQFFRQLPEAARDLLVRTAHLDDIDGDLANHTTQRDDCWGQLAALAETHSLVTYDPGKNSYRYHQLLGDFLLEKQTHLGEPVVRALNRRSAGWFFTHNRLSEAIAHAVRAGDPALGARYLVKAGGVRVGFREGAAPLAARLNLLPQATVDAVPRLAVARAYVLLKSARIGEAELVSARIRNTGPAGDRDLERDLTLVEAHMRVYSDRALRGQPLDSFARTAHATPPENPVLRGLFFNFLCIFQYQAGQFVEARTAGETALSHFIDADTPHLQFFMHLHLGAIDLDEGKVDAAATRHAQARDIQSACFAGDSSLWAIVEGFGGELGFELDGLENANLDRVLAISARAEAWSEFFLASCETAIAQAWQAGGIGGATGLIERAKNIALRRPLPRFARHLDMLHLEYATRAGHEREAGRLAARVRKLHDRSGPHPLQWRGRLMREMALARYAARFGDPRDTLARLRDLAENTAQQGFLRYAQRLDVQCFLIAARLRDKASAVQHLTSAVLRVPELNGVFLREGKAFGDAARWTLREAGLRVFPDRARVRIGRLLNRDSPAAAPKADFLAFFSPGERKILPHLAAGAPNKVIARELGLTESTIKYHLKNIFARLGVNSRKLAADILRSAGVAD